MFDSFKKIVFFAVSALFAAGLVLPPVSASELVPLTQEPQTPFFSVDTDFTSIRDLYRGQKFRRSGSSGRIWTNIYYDMTTLKPKDAGVKFKPDAEGIQFGLDFQHGGMYSTLFGNVQSSDFSVLGGKSKAKNYLFGYGKFFYLSGCHFGGNASIGYDEYKITARGISGSGDGLQANLFGEYGIDLIFGQWGFKPFYDLQYDFLYHGRIPNYASDWNGHSLNHSFGMRLNWKATEFFELQFRTAWVHEFLGNPPPFYQGRFSAVHGTATPNTLFYGGNIGRDWAWLGCGIKLECLYSMYVFLDYDGMFNARQTSHLFNAGLCLSW
jgi:hypothetical protein